MGTEEVQLMLVMFECQVLHKVDTSMLECNAFVTINLILQAIHCPPATISIQLGPLSALLESVLDWWHPMQGLCILPCCS